MGTVFKQPVRDRHHVTARDVLDHIDTMKRVAQEAGISLDQAIEVWRVMEQARANNIAVADGDIHDEQMSDFAQILDAARMSMDSVATALTNTATELHFIAKKG